MTQADVVVGVVGIGLGSLVEEGGRLGCLALLQGYEALVVIAYALVGGGVVMVAEEEFLG